MSKKDSLQLVRDSFLALAQALGAERTIAVKAAKIEIEADEKAAMMAAVSVAKVEFAKISKTSRPWIYLVLLLVFAAFGVSVVTVAWSASGIVKGAVSITSVGAMFGLLVKARQLLRDQLMLDFIMSKYELALGLCRTREEAKDIVERFLKETSSLSQIGAA